MSRNLDDYNHIDVLTAGFCLYVQFKMCHNLETSCKYKCVFFRSILCCFIHIYVFTIVLNMLWLIPFISYLFISRVACINGL